MFHVTSTLTSHVLIKTESPELSLVNLPDTEGTVPRGLISLCFPISDPTLLRETTLSGQISAEPAPPPPAALPTLGLLFDTAKQLAASHEWHMNTVRTRFMHRIEHAMDTRDMNVRLSSTSLLRCYRGWGTFQATNSPYWSRIHYAAPSSIIPGACSSFGDVCRLLMAITIKCD